MLNNEAAHNTVSPPELGEILASLWSFKIYIIIICFVAGLASIYVAINTPNVYRSEALLAPTEDLQGKSNEMSSQLDGLATLAGLGSLDSKGFKTEVAQAKILTKEFLYGFITEHDLILDILAVKSWNRDSKEVTYDDEVYDAETKKFILPDDLSLEWLTYKVMSENLIIDKVRGGFISISYEHPSPIVAQYVVENIVKDINNQMQNFDIEQSNKSIKYLEEKLQQTNIADMQSMFYRLIEEQIKNKMLTEIKSEYIFTTLDPAIVAEEKSGPRRVLIIIVSVLLAGIFGCFIGLIRFYRGR
ncbi:Wzz/FepE/Etk N-terminal domain-containing protein [Pseudoalteromonas apostichopi]|uniref:Wzz/FepE/Etk N-terminal domain-containing protein n=1 Tax=Pseudoalteromonas apostichopi TaxID=3035452 RepID=UPI002573E36A|nr:Wzz/FepE/Etk N-terminal domain-containing protein [Pseudoalteromonas sp. FE4]